MWMLLKKKHISQGHKCTSPHRGDHGVQLGLQKIKEDINDVEKRLKNIIDVLGRIENTPTFLKFFLFFLTFLKNLESHILKMHTVCHHVPSRDILVRVLGVQPLPCN
ncbi:hypothetical protein AB205_0220110 [Aquarana catesbeiana]|uniref:Uncharacterized protein n=1 Tax=Aquarana catesbeiana TaxID=8400 RepID=A0A2G9R8L5_AQUCT|nr:hypothetical protein AB205_0220110 [Aquarana catesbeiana]